MIPFQITFRDFPSSDAVWLSVQNRVEKMERLFDNIQKCEVVVSAPHRHSASTHYYHVQINLIIPAGDIFINRESEKNDEHTDIYIAIRDAFDAAEKQLKSRVSRMRREVKAHSRAEVGRRSP